MSPAAPRENDATLRLALLLHEAGVLDSANWQTLARKAGLKGDKGAWEILNQDVSVSTIKELLLLDLVPGRSVTGFQQALTAPLRIFGTEIAYTLGINEPDVARLCRFFIRRELMTTENLERALDDAERENRSVYDVLVEQNLITPDIITRAISTRESDIAHANRLAFSLRVLDFNGVLSPEDFLRAVEDATSRKVNVADSLAQMGILPQDKLMIALERGMAVPSIELMTTELSTDLLDRFPAELMRRQMFLPVSDNNGMIEIATADPFNTALADTLAILSDRSIVFLYARHNDLLGKFQYHFSDELPLENIPMEISAPRVRSGNDSPWGANDDNSSDGNETTADITSRGSRYGSNLEPFVDNMSAVQLVSQMVEGAIAAKATDIHVEPQGDAIRVRYRVDGELLTVMRAPITLLPSITSRIKVLAGMNVTERRRPQDGHCAFSTRNESYDLRISTMPTRGGEKIVMRVLDSSRVKTGLQELGLEADQLMTLSHLVARPSGMVLVTGPTGSGKTSTLYACLCTVNRESVNIITIEDPIEYQLEGITQVQVDPGIELGFANGLRSSLRQDPDVIMVGEVRDPDTARVAVRAALTGHLVFSTMHANTAVGAMNTLANMGVPHYLVAPALSGIISQRLVRCICKFCREEYEVPEGELVELGMSSDTKETHFYHGAGCDKCFNTGYNGRIGVFEVVGVSPDLREALLQQKNIPEMETIARRNSISLLEAGRQKVIAGTTTASEAVKGVVLQ
ncbi:hypothetical protein CVU37_00580 [candidate division BRC1 bacterium HGW-BRC1-1]|jgi:type II secretory ATPase GspE/PulE/Tfp pilus assembly ATPase PilB-like protein|nr:MAG: hypothetical protein CVU37_00580 [candidate division BRC1 bacterium HGW-BRC1-1]